MGYDDINDIDTAVDNYRDSSIKIMEKEVTKFMNRPIPIEESMTLMEFKIDVTKESRLILSLKLLSYLGEKVESCPNVRNLYNFTSLFLAIKTSGSISGIINSQIGVSNNLSTDNYTKVTYNCNSKGINLPYMEHLTLEKDLKKLVFDIATKVVVIISVTMRSSYSDNETLVTWIKKRFSSLRETVGALDSIVSESTISSIKNLSDYHKKNQSITTYTSMMLMTGYCTTDAIMPIERYTKQFFQREDSISYLTIKCMIERRPIFLKTHFVKDDLRKFISLSYFFEKNMRTETLFPLICVVLMGMNIRHNFCPLLLELAKESKSFLSIESSDFKSFNTGCPQSIKKYVQELKKEWVEDMAQWDEISVESNLPYMVTQIAILAYNSSV